ncbi:MAG: carboxypeptidase M32 [Clostridia bacterium]|nr:carboxypeptidase M32 [Clostridia bacterium]
MELEQAKRQLMELQAKLSAYDHAMGLISYDGDTTAPKGTADNRAQTLGVLSEIHYTLSTGADTVALLEYLDENKEALTQKEQRMVYLLLKDIRFKQKIPLEEYVAYEKLVVESQDVWHRAKENSDFASFEPYLEKMFETQKRFAAYARPDMDAYDYWLNEYETGLNKAVLDDFFGKLKARLVPLIKKCAAAPQVSDGAIKGDFDEAGQKKLALWLMELMGLNMQRVGLSTTEHPFTTSLGSHKDERITTHYYREDVSYSMFSVIHEGGHALYDTGSDEELAYTVLDGGVSMGIHESQSRFYENILGRSRAFIKTIFPKLCELFPEHMADYSWEDFYRAVNRVEPSLIRTEADEVTYCLHVMIRYELEKRVMAGTLSVRDLPGEWNRLYKEYLGIDVPDDRHGVLQDSHWSFGAIGYFPSYALGSAYGAQFLSRMKECVDVDAALEKGDFGPINDWNRQHIWHYGRLLEPGLVLENTFGAPFDPGYYLDYLEAKVKDVYGV